MKQYITYDKSTGKILRTGCCPASMMHLQADSAAEGVLEGEANDIIKKVYKGVVIDKSITELIAQEEATKPNQREELIRKRMSEILRLQAITELRMEGKIN